LDFWIFGVASVAPASAQIERSAQIDDKRPAAEKEKKGKEEKQSDDLAGKLMRKALNDSDEDLMDGIMRLMGDVSQKLQIDFDPGEQTQTVQRKISEKLDEAIKVAASRRRMRTVNPPAQGPDKRTLPSTAKRPEPLRNRKQGEVAESSSSEAPSEVTEVKAPAPGGELRDARRGWGNLPQRERDEVIQGVDEEFLERYRMWIERYYRSLQESDR
jgi:hypothetical protein